jgi:hypothetical protein
MEGDTTIAEVKTKIGEQTNIPADDQILTFGRTELQDDAQLSDYNIAADTAIYLIDTRMGMATLPPSTDQVSFQHAHPARRALHGPADDVVLTIYKKGEEDDVELVDPNNLIKGVVVKLSHKYKIDDNTPFEMHATWPGDGQKKKTTTFEALLQLPDSTTIGNMSWEGTDRKMHIDLIFDSIQSKPPGSSDAAVDDEPPAAAPSVGEEVFAEKYVISPRGEEWLDDTWLNAAGDPTDIFRVVVKESGAILRLAKKFKYTTRREKNTDKKAIDERKKNITLDFIAEKVVKMDKFFLNINILMKFMCHVRGTSTTTNWQVNNVWILVKKNMQVTIEHIKYRHVAFIYKHAVDEYTTIVCNVEIRDPLSSVRRTAARIGLGMARLERNSKKELEPSQTVEMLTKIPKPLTPDSFMIVSMIETDKYLILYDGKKQEVAGGNARELANSYFNRNVQFNISGKYKTKIEVGNVRKDGVREGDLKDRMGKLDVADPDTPKPAAAAAADTPKPAAPLATSILSAPAAARRKPVGTPPTGDRDGSPTLSRNDFNAAPLPTKDDLQVGSLVWVVEEGGESVPTPAVVSVPGGTAMVVVKIAGQSERIPYVRIRHRALSP